MCLLLLNRWKKDPTCFLGFLSRAGDTSFIAGHDVVSLGKGFLTFREIVKTVRNVHDTATLEGQTGTFTVSKRRKPHSQ